MVRTKNEQKVEFKCIRNGNGEAELRLILNGADEMYGKGRLFNHMILAPGRSVGDHTHTGDNEIYYFLKGSGLYNDNGKSVRVIVCGIRIFRQYNAVALRKIVIVFQLFVHFHKLFFRQRFQKHIVFRGETVFDEERFSFFT